GGTVKGTGAAPARLDAEVLAGSVLRHVIVGTDAVLHPTVDICGDVQFAEGARLPPGLDLSCLLQPLPWSRQESIESLNLNLALYETGVTLLDGLRELPALQGVTMLWDEASGELRVDGGTFRSRLVPVRVKQSGGL